MVRLGMPFNPAKNLDFFAVFTTIYMQKLKDINMPVTSMTYVKPAKNSHKEILEWANERRPYEPSDLMNVCRTKGLFPRLDIEKGR